LLSLLIFLPTVYSVPHYFYLLAIIPIIFRDKGFYLELSSQQMNSFYLITFIIFLSLLNYMIGIPKLNSISNVIPYFIVYLLTFYISSKLTDKDLRILIWIIFIEILFVFFEFYNGINTIFTSNIDYRNGLSYEYLYFFRPHGLSSGSSTISYKIMIMLILIDYLKLNTTTLFKILKYVGLLAMIITFNRTVIIAMTLYYLMKNYKIFLNFRNIFIAIILISTVLYYNFELILAIIDSQFNRGKDTLDLSYRDVIWLNNFNFIENNILFGNNSIKYLTLLDVYDELEHAHNSFIQILSTNGIVIFMLYVFLIVFNLKKTNFIYIVPFLIYSTYQYGIFWAISIVDIIFLYLLIFKRAK